MVEYGRLSLIISVAVLLSMLAKCGGDGVLIRVVPTKVRDRDETLTTLLIMCTIITVLGIMPIMLFFYWYFPFLEVLNIFLVMYPLSIIGLISSYERSTKRFIVAEFTDGIIRPIFLSISILILDIIYGATVEFVILSACCISLILVSSKLYAYRNELEYQLRGLFERSRNLSKYGASFLLVSAASLLQNQIDILMIGYYLTMEEVAFYSVSTRIVMPIGLVLAVVSTLSAPKISHNFSKSGVESLNDIVHETKKPLLAFSFLALVFGGTLGPYFIVFTFGDVYIQSVTSFYILMVGKVIESMCGIVVVLLNNTDNHWRVTKILWVTLIFNIIANFILIPLYGIEGAAFATAMSVTLWSVFLVLFARNILSINTLVFKL